MLLRRILTVLLAFIAVHSTAQEKTKPTRKKSPQATINTYIGGDADTCLDKKFSIVFYGIDDSAMKRTIVDFDMAADSLIRMWNRAFQRICVSFVRCSTVIIPNYEFNRWEFLKTDQAVLRDWYTEKTINVYLPERLLGGPGGETGAYAYDNVATSGLVRNPLGVRPSTLSVIVVERGPVNPLPTFAMDAMHAIGHFFGLPDTFAETGIPATPTPTNSQVSSTEFVDGTNSAVNGDRFQDTEADCFPAGMNQQVNLYSICGYANNVKDAKGQWYQPPVENFMSRWLPCGCRFTQQQYNYMARYILKNRLHLH